MAETGNAMTMDEADLDWLKWHTEPSTGSRETQRRARNVLAELERQGAAIALVRSMCDVWADREPNCAGVRAIRDELNELDEESP